MNGRNRHNRYRRKVYKQHGVLTAVISVCATLAVVIVSLVIAGNVLRAKNAERFGPTDSETAPPIEQQQVRLPALSAYSATLGANSNTRIEELKAKEITEVSIALNKADGSLLYGSSTAAALGIGSAENVELKATCDHAKSLGFYVSGIYYLNALNSESKPVRSVELSKAAAVISDAIASGVDEVIVIAPSATAEHTQELLLFLDEIRFLANDAKIGLGVSDKIFESEDAANVLNELDKAFNTLALDSSAHGETAPAEYVDACINSTKSFYIRMYGMRLLLPYSSDEAVQSGIIAAAENNGIKNWQIFQNG